MRPPSPWVEPPAELTRHTGQPTALALATDVFYSDAEGGQPAITRFTLTPISEMRSSDEDDWVSSVARHWNVDRCLTGDTLLVVTDVTIRELRNHGGEVVDRVLAGEHLVVTRAGQPVAELRPLKRRGLDVGTLLARWRHLPHVDPKGLRADLDSAIDPSL